MTRLEESVGRRKRPPHAAGWDRRFRLSMRCLFLLTAAALLAFAQKDEPRKLRAYYLDGTGVEFEQEATGSTVLALHGGGLAVSDEGIERIVPDKDGNILYAYFVEAWASPQPGAVTIRIKPLD